jgi:hypothetical protein
MRLRITPDDSTTKLYVIADNAYVTVRQVCTPQGDSSDLNLTPAEARALGAILVALEAE